MSLHRVKKIILVLSGKGGVGKSSITTQLALSLSLAGHSVGVLDVDLTGPSIPRFFGIENEKIKQAPDGWIPVQVHQAQKLPPSTQHQAEPQTSPDAKPIGSLHAMSLAFLLASRSTAIVWRGPKKTAMIRQFLSDVNWPAIDYLLIDTPPGTSDEHISVVETLLKNTVGVGGATESAAAGPRLAGAVLVTTPQAVATADVRKEINFCAKTGVPVIGVVENMSGYICPCCGVSTNLFSKGGGEVMAGEFGLGFLGGVPIDRQWGMLVEEGRRPVYKQEVEGGDQNEGDDGVDEIDAERVWMEGNKHADGLLVDKYRDCELYPIFEKIAKQITEIVEGNMATLVDPHAVRTI